jgi:hypothetical protein
MSDRTGHKMEGLCLCFVRLSYEEVARRPNGLRYSRDLVWVHSRSRRPLWLLHHATFSSPTILSCYSSHSSLLSLELIIFYSET